MLIQAAVVMVGIASGAQAATEPPASAVPLSVTAPVAGAAVRVGGDVAAAVARVGEVYRAGDCRIDTPLPVGYPDPTPPGAIDLKSYPSVRRAEVGGEMNPDLGMNMGFWPLFRHIQRRDIAMTSPVELDYHAPAKSPLKDAMESSERRRWTMSFLYRDPSNGPLGEDGSVRIIDTQPVTVVAIGFQGSYSESNSQKQLKTLREWIATQAVWEEAGDPRMLYYNGPDVAGGRKWGEAQIPVRRVEPAAPQPGDSPVSNHEAAATNPERQ